MYGYIYKTTNLVSGKIYVGQHKSSKFLGKRYLGSGRKLKESIKHYGKKNFKVELLEEVETKELMDEREIYWISVYNSTNKEIGYNLSEGGNVNRTLNGENHPLYGKHHREESIKKNRCSNSNKVVVHNDDECIKIEPNLLNKYLNMGYIRGYGKFKPKHNSKPAWNKGLNKSMDNRLNGNHHPHTNETKIKIGQSVSKKLLGHKVSQEAVEKIRKSLTKYLYLFDDNVYTYFELQNKLKSLNYNISRCGIESCIQGKSRLHKELNFKIYKIRKTIDG